MFFEDFPNRMFNLMVNVIGTDFTDIDVIIGREFLEEHKLTLVYNPCKNDSDPFTRLLPHTDVCYTGIFSESIIKEAEIDFPPTDKERLKDAILEVENSENQIIQDDYCVRVHLKDTTTYAYAPRKFALAERKITDDLL